MSVKRLKRDKRTRSRVPFPELPLPSQYRKIRRVEEKEEPEPQSLEIIQEQGPKPVLKPKPPKSIVKIDVPEPIVGGELVPEPPKVTDKGDHVVEDLDYSDYE